MPAKLSAPPTTSAEVRSLMASEVVKSSPDKDRLRFLGELLVSFEKVEAQTETAASKLLPAVTNERDALAAKIAELQPIADKVPELEMLKADMDSWKVEQTKLLVSEAQQYCWKAERAENAATAKLREADNKVSASGWTELRTTLADLIAHHSMPMPDFWETSATMPSAFWELWGWSATKAKVYTAYKAGYKEPNEAFKAQAFRILTAGLPSSQYAAPTEIPDLGVRRDCILEMAQRFGCEREIQQRADDEAVSRQSQHLREHYAMMAAAQSESSRRGEGRTPISVAEPSSVPLSEHLPGCLCKACGGNVARLPNSMDEVL